MSAPITILNSNLNLFSELGVSNKVKLEKSPTLILRTDGTMIIWEQWRHFMNRKKGTSKEKYSHYINLTTVQEILYTDKMKLRSRNKKQRDNNISFYDSSPEGNEPYFTMHPLWLALPEFRNFLNEHLVVGVRNDFDPDKNWMKRTNSLNPSTAGTVSIIDHEGSITWESVAGEMTVVLF